jgi:hypothetical protein
VSRCLPGSTPCCPVWCLCASLRAGSGAGLPASGFSTEGSGCLKTKRAPSRKIARSIHEAAREKARAIARTETCAVSRRERKRVEMLFAHLKRILKLDQFRLRGPSEAKERFYWPPPPKICGNWRSLSPFPPRSSPQEAERPRFASLTAVATRIAAPKTEGFFNEIPRDRSVGSGRLSAMSARF